MINHSRLSNGTTRKDLAPAPKADTRKEIEEARAKIADLMGDAEIRAIEKDKATMMAAMTKFTSTLRQAVAPEYQCGTVGVPHSIEKERGLHDVYNLVPNTFSNPPSARAHQIMRVQDGVVIASVGFEDAPAETYYSGPIADEVGLMNAAEEKAARVAVQLLDVLRVRIAARYGA